MTPFPGTAGVRAAIKPADEALWQGPKPWKERTMGKTLKIIAAVAATMIRKPVVVRPTIVRTRKGFTVRKGHIRFQ